MEAAGVHIPGESAEEGLSLEKSWQVIHYLLTGQIDQAPPPWEMPSWAGKRSVRNETMDEYDS